MKTRAFTIRQATLADLDDICAVDQEAFALYGTAEDRVIFASRQIAYRAGSLVLVANGEVAGYASAEKWAADREPQIGEDPFATHDPAGRVFCITGMALQATHQGRGGGRALLARLLMLARAEECEKVVLETSHAAGFYRKHGFTAVGERRYGEARLDVMELRLQPAGEPGGTA